MKIAMLSVHSCPVGNLGGKDTGGMNVYIRELARELGRRGHSVDIHTRAHDPREAQIVELAKGARLIHLEAGEVEDVHKLVVYSYLDEFACSLENFRKRHGLEYDLIHSHYWLSGWAGRRIKDWWQVPHITMFHTLGAVKNAIGVGEDDPELRIQTERELATGCDCIIAATEAEKEQLVGYYNAPGEAISVIPCGVNLDLFQPVDREMARQHLGFDGGSIALFVGRIEPLKGIDRLLMAMTYLDKKEKVRLVVVGGDEQSQPELERLQSLAHDLNIQDSVAFAGMVRQEELPQYYSAADVCIIPSYYESFGLVALESLACGTPVVATRVGGMESVVSQDKTGYVVGDNNPHHLADKIAEILSKPDSRAQIAAAARAAVARFSWVNIAEEIVQQYEAVLRDCATR
ncbi:MAG: glycosyltransferase [Dehalococcoidia bacterium]|nr:glycosyltransferase [Dehalococcoidia bacterium]